MCVKYVCVEFMFVCNAFLYKCVYIVFLYNMLVYVCVCVCKGVYVTVHSVLKVSLRNLCIF